MPVYTVRSGDTLSEIARRSGTTVAELVRLNGISNPDRIGVGQRIELPYNGAQAAPQAPQSSAATYTVRAGDTLSKIARANGTTWQELASLNNLSNPDRLSIGQTIRLSPAPPQAAPRPQMPLPTGNPNRAYNPQAAANEIELNFMRREQAKGNDLYATGWRPSYTPGYEVPSPPPQAAPPMPGDQGGRLPLTTDVAQSGYPSNMLAGAPRQAGGIDYGSLTKPELDNLFGRMNLGQLNTISVDQLSSPLALRTFSEHLERARRLEAGLFANYQQGAERAQANFAGLPVMSQPIAPMAAVGPSANGVLPPTIGGMSPPDIMSTVEAFLPPRPPQGPSVLDPFRMMVTPPALAGMK